MTNLLSEEKLRPTSVVKRTRIIAAAKSLFLANGFAKTSMDAIRVEAGVSKPTLYNHFKSKEDLYIGIMMSMMDDFANQWSTESTGEIIFDSIQHFQNVLSQLAHSALGRMMNAEYIDLARSVISSGAQFPKLAETFKMSVPCRALDIIINLLDSANRQNIITIEDTVAGAQLFMGGILYHFMLNGLLSQTPTYPDDKEIESIVTLFIKII